MYAFLFTDLAFREQRAQFFLGTVRSARGVDEDESAKDAEIRAVWRFERTSAAVYQRSHDARGVVDDRRSSVLL